MKRHIIDGIVEGSIAEELEIEAGDVLISINDKEIQDIFDYQYLAEDEYLDILIEKKNGEEWILEVEKDPDEDLGLIFGESLMDQYRNCHNKCVFCFIDQNPPGMRETIYFKDDDTRLSFLQGNYVSLTNLKEDDIKRIIEYKLAPINISVHTTNPELRCKMLNNRFAGRVLKYMDMLYEAEIPMNAQIVLCKNMNDGKELERTLGDLIKYAPALKSVTIVPVGLTKHREGLCELESFNREDAVKLTNLVKKYQDIAMEKLGCHFVHASDEWYINAGIEIPNDEVYDGFNQLENGVGMVRLMHSEIDRTIEEYLEEHNNELYMEKKTITCVCGMLVKDYMQEAVDKLNRVAPNVSFNVYPIRNDFFGEKITVTGLLTGGDIVAQIKDKELGDAVFLPCNCLKADEDIFLDDMTLNEFQNALQVPVIIVQSSGMDFLDSLIEMER